MTRIFKIRLGKDKIPVAIKQTGPARDIEKKAHVVYERAVGAAAPSVTVVFSNNSCRPRRIKGPPR
jgi:hypothetical protein